MSMYNIIHSQYLPKIFIFKIKKNAEDYSNK